jgi:antitoxin CptB
MTGTKISTENLDPRRKRILIRSWRRGTREMDLLLGEYADLHIADMSDSDLDMFERLMAAQDTDLYKWVSGEKPIDPEFDSPLAQTFLKNCADGQYKLDR